MTKKLADKPKVKLTNEQKADEITRIGRLLRVKKDMKLSGSALPMVPELQALFGALIPIMSESGKRRLYSLQNAATALNRLNVTSSEGRIVQPSHVSNAVRKSIKKIGAAYEKANYKGKNHFSFGSKSAPMKSDCTNAG